VPTVSRHTARRAGRIEKRKQGRTALGLKGKLFIPESATEDDCRVVDFSPDGAGVVSAISAPIGTKLVLYVDGFGRFEGTVVARDRMRLGLQFQSGSVKRTRTAEQLLEYVVSGTTGAVPLRHTLRASSMPQLQDFAFADGRRGSCEVADIALGGALLRTEDRPAIGEILSFGGATARVVRHTDEGIAIQFIAKPTPAAA